MSSKGASPFFSDSKENLKNFILSLEVLEVYTDGCCLKNPGDGGYAVLFLTKNNIFIYKEKVLNTTSNIVELLAVTTAVEILQNKNVIIKTDSKYVCDGYNLYLNNWVRQDWKNNQKKTIANLELWKKLYLSMLDKKFLKIEWVKGHNKIYYNELVDKFAKEAAGYKC